MQRFEISNGGHTYVLDISDRPHLVAPLWQQLDHEPADSNLTTCPYQTYRFCHAWFATEGQHAAPLFITLARSGGDMILAFPLAVEARFGLRYARWPGGSHCNFAAPFSKTGEALAPSLLHAIFAKLAESCGIDFFALKRIVQDWNGRPNPLYELATAARARALHQTILPCYEDNLAVLRSKAHRKQLDTKRDRLAQRAALRMGEAVFAQERAMALDAFIDHKNAQLERKNLSSPFTKGTTQKFMRQLMTAPHTFLRLFTLHSGATLAAVFIALQSGKRLSGLATSYAPGELEPYSPGELLLTHVLRTCAAEGVTRLDLGAGTEDYKRRWLHETCPSGAYIKGFSARGMLASNAYRVGLFCWRYIKQWRWAYKQLARLRNRLRL